MANPYAGTGGYSPFATPPTQPNSGIMRQPGNGMAGQFDMEAVMNHLRQMYPQSDDSSLSSMAQQQMQRAQSSRVQGLAGEEQGQGQGQSQGQATAMSTRQQRRPMF